MTKENLKTYLDAVDIRYTEEQLDALYMDMENEYTLGCTPVHTMPQTVSRLRDQLIESQNKHLECPKCKGTGKIEFFDGGVERCKLCDGYGVGRKV